MSFMAFILSTSTPDDLHVSGELKRKISFAEINSNFSYGFMTGAPKKSDGTDRAMKNQKRIFQVLWVIFLQWRF
jgi:hypothetical protein